MNYVLVVSNLNAFLSCHKHGWIDKVCSKNTQYRKAPSDTIGCQITTEFCIFFLEGNKPEDLSSAVQVMRRIHILLEKYQDLLEKSHLQKLSQYLQLLGFENLACTLSGQVTF